MNTIPPQFLDILADETRAYAFLATTMKDGTPQVTPVWFNTQADYILVNSAAGRTKDRNMRKRPQVALAIQDPQHPYRYVQISGRVVEATTTGAIDHLNTLSQKYRGRMYYEPGAPLEQRVIYKILPESVNTMG